MAYYYINPDDQNYPPNYLYYNQPHYSDQYHHNTYCYYSDSPSCDGHDQYGYGGYSNEQHPVRYDDQNQYYNNQFHSNSYQHLPTQSLIAYHYNNSAYPEFPAKKDSNLLDPGVTTGFVVSYSNTDPQSDLEFEEYNPEPFQGGYKMDEIYGKPLPPSEDICYPPSKSDLAPPPPSPFGKLEKDLETPPVKNEENVEDGDDDDDDDDDDQGSESEGDEEDKEEEEEEQEKQEENRGILIAPPLLGKEDQSIIQGDAKPANGSFVNEQPREEDEEDEEEDEEEEEKRYYTWDDGKVEEKETRQQIPPGAGMETLDLCDRVFGGYFPCWRKRNQGDASDQGGSTDTVSYGNEDSYGECMDYLFGDPNPYARAIPDPIYGCQRYYPQQPICEQVEYGGNHTYTLSDDSSYYGYNGLGY